MNDAKPSPCIPCLAFREAVDLVMQVSSQAREISAAVQEMVSGSQKIIRSAKKIAILAK